MFTLRWKQSALDELATIWVQAPQGIRASITRASEEIDDRLARDPLGEGESRDGARRIIFAGPLGAIYSVDASRLVVRVLHVWTFRQRA